MKQDSVATVVVGFLETNCYLVFQEKGHCLYIIDPGEDAGTIIDMARTFEAKRFKILLTHGHVDHIRGVPEIARELGVSGIYLHKNDFPLYMSPKNSVLPWIPAVKDLPAPSDTLDDDSIKIIHTPGHTQGSVCFHFHKMDKLFSGDTLFRESVGRTDLPGGSTESLEKSIKHTLFRMPDSLQVFPGHGQSTSIGHEKRHNPFA